MVQTWKIRGQVYTHAQLMELKKQGLDPRKDDIVMKFISNPGLRTEEEVQKKAEKNKKAEELKKQREQIEKIEKAKGNDEYAEQLEAENENKVETEEEEFARLKLERAWVNPEKKARYNELKAKFA